MSVGIIIFPETFRVDLNAPLAIDQFMRYEAQYTLIYDGGQADLGKVNPLMRIPPTWTNHLLSFASETHSFNKSDCVETKESSLDIPHQVDNLIVHKAFPRGAVFHIHGVSLYGILYVYHDPITQSCCKGFGFPSPGEPHT